VCIALQTAAPDLVQQMGYILEEVYTWDLWARPWTFECWRVVHGLAASVAPKNMGEKPIGSLNFCHRFGVLAFYFSLKDKEYQLAIEQGLRVQ
jgi:hypothetical protein